MISSQKITPIATRGRNWSQAGGASGAAAAPAAAKTERSEGVDMVGYLGSQKRGQKPADTGAGRPGRKTGRPPSSNAGAWQTGAALRHLAFREHRAYRARLPVGT